jgi:hypothetical protein
MAFAEAHVGIAQANIAAKAAYDAISMQAQPMPEEMAGAPGMPQNAPIAPVRPEQPQANIQPGIPV